MSLREYLRSNRFIAFLYWLPVHILILFSKILPLQNKIVFSNFSGKGFADDPKYILLQIARQKPKIKLVWLLNDINQHLPPTVKKVKYGTPWATYHYTTAKIWIDNVKNNPKPTKRKKQFYLQTWHGSFANKTVEKDAEPYLDKNYIEVSQKDSQIIDLMYSNNDFKINLFKNSFWYNGPVIKSDSPQLATLLNPPPRLKTNICSSYQIDDNKKILLYAPTFRKGFNVDIYKWDFKAVLNTLEKKFGEQFVLFFRLHPNISNLVNCGIFNQSIINVTSYPDMDELMAISDIMITDFSGVAYDMALAKKPVFLFAKDYEDYIKNDRPQYFEQKDLPFSFAKTEDELKEHILNFQESAYQEKTLDFFNKIGMQESGNGAENIANIVLEQITK